MTSFDLLRPWGQDPWGGYGSLRREMDELFDRFGTSSPALARGAFPALNLYETEAEYLVCVDLAGVDKDKIDITVHDQRLTLRGHRVVPTPEDVLAATAGDDHLVGVHPEGQPTRRVRVHVMEIDHGALCREVELPHDVHQEQINARYLNGVLWIQLPKK